jgi:hypothetical protein
MAIDGLEVKRDGGASHCLWLAPTGGGKSTAVATIRCDGKRAMLAVMPDLSDPLRERADFIWTACVSTVPINFCIGEPTEVAERFTEVFRSGGTGAWKRKARRATAKVIRDIDAEGLPRSMRLVGLRLQKLAAGDKDLTMVLSGWIDRFLDLAEQLGPSMEAGGVDIAELLRNGKMIVMDNDAFEHASLGGDVVALGLAEAKRVANLVPGGFRLIFEEAQQLGDRIDLAHPFFLAGRRRGIAVDALAQAEDGLDSILTQNSRTKVYFPQEDQPLQRLAGRRLGIPYEELDPGHMAEFTAWVSHGSIRRLVHFPAPKKVRPRVIVSNDEPIEQEWVDVPWEVDSEPGVVDGEPGAIYQIREIEPDPEAGLWEPDPLGLPRRAWGAIPLPAGAVEAPAWIGRNERRLEIWQRLDGTWSEQGDHLWRGGTNKGYGKTWYLNVGGWQTHFLFWAWKVMFDHEQGQRGDLERFYQANPDVPEFAWPAVDDELVVLRALKTWMRRPDEDRTRLSLSVDHCCPGFPNALCGNWRHHQLVADEPGREGSNSKLRWQRRTGAGRLEAEGVAR